MPPDAVTFVPKLDAIDQPAVPPRAVGALERTGVPEPAKDTVALFAPVTLRMKFVNGASAVTDWAFT